MIRVIIRDVDDRNGELLGEFAAEDLATLVKVVSASPVYNGFNGKTCQFCLAHFVLDDDGAYFEIIVEKD